MQSFILINKYGKTKCAIKCLFLECWIVGCAFGS